MFLVLHLQTVNETALTEIHTRGFLTAFLVGFLFFLYVYNFEKDRKYRSGAGSAASQVP